MTNLVTRILASRAVIRYSQGSMDSRTVDNNAIELGYTSATDWLQQAEYVAAEGLASPRLLDEYREIFWTGRAITRDEARLIDAIEGPPAKAWVFEKWPHADIERWLDADGVLSAEATRSYFDALDALDRL